MLNGITIFFFTFSLIRTCLISKLDRYVLNQNEYKSI